jgi:hypothetical protein
MFKLSKKDSFMSRILTRGAWVLSQDCACGIFGGKKKWYWNVLFSEYLGFPPGSNNHICAD